MEIFKSILDFIGKMAWPGVVLVLVLVFLKRFKASIVSLIDRLNELSGAGAVAKFGPLNQAKLLKPDVMEMLISGKINQTESEAEQAIGNETVTIVDGDDVQPINEIHYSEEAKKQIEELSKRRKFERVYNLIWGTQFQLLLALVSTPMNVLTLKMCRRLYYDHYVAMAREVKAEVVSLDEYLQTLEISGFIKRLPPAEHYLTASLPIVHTDSVQLTDGGKEFIDYIEKNYYELPYRPF